MKVLRNEPSLMCDKTSIKEHHYMINQQFDLKNMSFIDLTHTLSPSIPHWSGACGFKHKVTSDYDDCSGKTKFRVQSVEMFAGTGTHMDAPALYIWINRYSEHTFRTTHRSMCGNRCFC